MYAPALVRLSIGINVDVAIRAGRGGSARRCGRLRTILDKLYLVTLTFHETLLFLVAGARIERAPRGNEPLVRAYTLAHISCSLGVTQAYHEEVGAQARYGGTCEMPP